MSWEFVLIGLAVFAVIAAGMVVVFYYIDPHRLARRRPDRFEPADTDHRTPNEPPRKTPPPPPGRKGTP